MEGGENRFKYKLISDLIIKWKENRSSTFAVHHADGLLPTSFGRE